MQPQDFNVAGLLTIFLAGVGTGLFGTLVGGSSLVTIPVLILLGLPPHTAIGTDRMGVTGIGFAGLYKFHKKGLVRYKIGLITGIPALLGSYIGATLVMQIDPSVLKKIIVAITVCLLVLVAVNPRVGVEKSQRPLTTRTVGLGMGLSLLIGIYAGFYGASAGTFLAYLLILVFGQTFLESAGTLKIGSITMTVTAALTFAYHGAIHYPLAVAMCMGSAIGSYAGAHYSDRLGNVWIKRLFIGIVLVMVIKLLAG